VSTDEHQILEFLKARPQEFLSAREVSRRLGKRRSQKEPTWAKPSLLLLTNGGHIMMNEIGHFRYKPPEDNKKKKEKLHLAPHIAKILAAGGKATVYDIGE